MKQLTLEKIEDLLKKMMTIDPILVLGDLGVDKYTYGEVRRISPEAPVPVMEVEKQWHKLGLAANVVDNFCALKIPSNICGIVGEDSAGVLFEHLLEENHIKTWGLVRSHGRTTILKERVTTKTQQICRIDYECQTQLTAQEESKIIFRIKDLFPGHSAVLLSDYSKGLLSEQVCQTVINLAKTSGALVGVDPGRDTPPNYYYGADLIKPNFTEAQIMCKHFGAFERPVEEMARLISEKLKIKKVVITQGAKGMACFDSERSDQIHLIPTLARDVYDVSGAGDTTMAFLMASLVAGLTLEESAWLANLGAAVVVGKRGTATVSSTELIEHFHVWKDKF